MKKVTRENEMYKYKSRVLSSTWDPSLYRLDTQKRLLLEIKQQVSGGSGSDAFVEKALHQADHLLMKKEVETKLSGYRFQDQHKKRTGSNISFLETIDKLLASDMLCYYCNQPCHVFYERVREMSQWSLDRIDNSLCHGVDNVVVSCLQCNLHRKNRNSQKFKDAKAMASVTLLPSEGAVESTENSEPFYPSPSPPPPTPPQEEEEEAFCHTRTRTRTRVIRPSIQKLTDDVVVHDGVVVSIQEKLH